MSTQGLLAITTLWLWTAPSWALSGTPCLSDDNHLYYIVTTQSDRVQITSVALTGGSASACSGSAGGNLLLAAALGQGGLLPKQMRTSVLRGFANVNLTCADFDPHGNGGKGILTLHVPLATPARTVSVGGGTEAIADVDESDAAAGISSSAGVVGAVPAAIDSPSVSRSIGGCSVSGTTMGFPFPAGSFVLSDPVNGETSGQTVTFDDTKNTRVGNTSVGTTQAQPDGFLLQGNCASAATCQVIIFIASPDSHPGFGAAAAGFTVDSSVVQTASESTSNNGTFHPPLPHANSPAVSVHGLIVIAGLLLVGGSIAIRRRSERP